MGARRFIRPIIEAADLELALKQLDEWGYPRPLEDGEAEAAAWVRYGDQCIFWFVALASRPEAYTLYICADPLIRGGLMTRQHFYGIRVLAEYHGADHLVFVTEREPDDEDDWQLDPRMGRYFERMGCSRNELGWELTLGEAA